MTTWVNSQFPRPDFHRQVQRHYGLQTQILTRSDPKIRGQEPKTLSKRAHNPLLKEAGLTKPTGAHPSGGPVAGGAIGISGMPLTACRRERPPHSDARKQAPRSWVS